MKSTNENPCAEILSMQSYASRHCIVCGRLAAWVHNVLGYSVCDEHKEMAFKYVMGWDGKK